MIMMKRYKKILFTGVLSALSCSFVHAQELYKNENAPVHERVMDLISRLTVEEKISLLRATSPGIPRLGIDKYYHGNEALHGVVRPGRFTVFPQAIGLAATWNPELQKRVATVISDEARARWNELDQGREQKEQFSDVLTARMKLGLFDSGERNPYTKISPSVIGSKEHQQIALDAARQCIVLLKNQKNRLPLNADKLKSIAVVGINAGKCEFGDYSGAPVVEPVSILQGIRNRVGDRVKVVYAPWKSAADGLELIQGENFPEGLQAEYFDNTRLEGTPRVRKESWINFEPANQAPDPFLPKSPLSVRWTGKLKPTVSGRYTFSFTSDDGCRLSIDNQMLIDAWQAHAVSTDSASIYLEAGKEYQLKAEYYDNRDYAIAKLQWKVPQIGKATRLDLYGEAGKAVRECETVVAVMGINKSIEREGQDRYDIQLPADQREFLQEIYKVNPNIIVVLVAGSSLAVNWMDEHVPAIVNAWYPGEQGGTAVAEVLFGDYNPAGRLPLTYYKSLDELPPFDDYDITKGRTYKYFKGDVLYPFGYGLSYSSFKYSDLQVKDGAGEVTVSFLLKNTGKRNGDEVAQVYVRIPETGGIVPLKELKGFRRVPLKSGESRRVEIKLSKEQLRYWDVEKGQFVVPKGAFDIMVGASSKDIRLQTVIDL